MGTRKEQEYSGYESCECIICGKSAKRKEISKPEGVRYHCVNCGDFYVTEEFEDDLREDTHEKLLKKTDLSKLAGYIRERNEREETSIWISEENVLEILNSSLIPHAISEKGKKLISFLDRRTTFLFEEVDFTLEESAICYANNEKELEGIIDSLSQQGLINSEKYVPWYDDIKERIVNLQEHFCVNLTWKGHLYAEELRKTERNSNSAFVAMWFSDEVRDAYESGIKAAVEDKEHYDFNAFLVSDIEHNDDVTDKIIAEIKAAQFVVADLTGNRGGVYYEAGFARGLGKPVILTCHKDWFNGNDENHKVHFDVNHLSIILWENAEELKEKLINRIRATIL